MLPYFSIVILWFSILGEMVTVLILASFFLLLLILFFLPSECPAHVDRVKYWFFFLPRVSRGSIKASLRESPPILHSSLSLWPGDWFQVLYPVSHFCLLAWTYLSLASWACACQGPGFAKPWPFSLPAPPLPPRHPSSWRTVGRHPDNLST